MKRLLLVLFLLPCGFLYAQQDTLAAHPDTVKTGRDIPDPQTVYNDELPKDLGPPKDSVLLTIAQVPRRLRKALGRNERYQGWENAEVYLNRNTGLYMLYLPKDDLMNKYGFDARGKVVTFTTFRKPS